MVRALPRVHLVHETVPTPWERLGGVMRELVEHPPPGELVLIDGVKAVQPDGWVLVLPDPEEPVMHVWAEGDSDVEARRFAQERVRAVRQALR